MRLAKPLGPDDHVLGPPNAPAVLLEYGDYECPYCGRAHLVVSELTRRVGDRMRFAFRHFPIIRLHPHALVAAQAAEAAGAQGQFWPMHATLFENQDALEPEDLMAYARALDLDVRRFARDLKTGVHAHRVLSDLRSGLQSGVQGTPTFYLNGLRLDAPWDLDTLTAAVLQAGSPGGGEAVAP
jgi:protein-disulfide isomerase